MYWSFNCICSLDIVNCGRHEISVNVPEFGNLRECSGDNVRFLFLNISYVAEM
jgi:hypothetical protein